MTRAIITQLVDALEVGWSPRFTGKDARALSDAAIKAAREYLANEPSGERAELINTPEKVREFFGSNFDSLRYAREDKEPDEGDKYTVSAHDIISAFDWSADMLEADVREAKRVPMSDGVIAVITDACFQAVADQGTTVLMRAVARAIEARHGITQGEKK